jgi:hypothetical protein
VEPKLIYHNNGEVLLQLVIAMPDSNCQIDLAEVLHKHAMDDMWKDSSIG